jgi:hypothetical protein
MSYSAATRRRRRRRGRGCQHVAGLVSVPDPGQESAFAHELKLAVHLAVRPPSHAVGRVESCGPYCGHCPLDGFVGIDRIDSTKRQYIAC